MFHVHALCAACTPNVVGACPASDFFAAVFSAVHVLCAQLLATATHAVAITMPRDSWPAPQCHTCAFAFHAVEQMLMDRQSVKKSGIPIKLRLGT